MSLRVNGPPLAPGDNPPPQDTNTDGWASRLAKLIPSEALGTYAATVALIPASVTGTVKLVALIVIAVACIAILVVVRVKSTSKGGVKPQVLAIIISAISFVIWTATLGPISPIPLPESVSWIPTVVAVLWVAAVGVFYRGDEGNPPEPAASS
ncbi:MAG: hypothetical protein J7515_21000 [Caulobacter sp.]|nr:hypothetical protein [Caulobacter sp.]